MSDPFKQKPFVCIPDANQPTVEDEAITIRAVNRGTYHFLNEMTLNDERDALNMRQQMESAVEGIMTAREEVGYLQDACDDPNWFLLPHAIY